MNPRHALPSVLVLLLLGSGCSAFEAPLGWLADRVLGVVPQRTATATSDPVEQADPQTTTEPDASRSADVQAEDWPELVDCGMG